MDFGAGGEAAAGLLAEAGLVWLGAPVEGQPGEVGACPFRAGEGLAAPTPRPAAGGELYIATHARLEQLPVREEWSFRCLFRRSDKPEVCFGLFGSTAALASSRVVPFFLLRLPADSGAREGSCLRGKQANGRRSLTGFFGGVNFFPNG